MMILTTHRAARLDFDENPTSWIREERVCLHCNRSTLRRKADWLTCPKCGCTDYRPLTGIDYELEGLS